MNTYHVYRWIDGRKCVLAATFDDLELAEAYVRENNAQPGSDTYEIDPAELPTETDQEAL